MLKRLMELPLTALLKSCSIWPLPLIFLEAAKEGVVNDKFEVHGYPNMYILDGSIMPCNLGVNPSLTITALSEYAMDLVEGKPDVETTLEKLLQVEVTHE